MDNSWECPACTFINDGLGKGQNCEMCGASAPVGASNNGAGSCPAGGAAGGRQHGKQRSGARSGNAAVGPAHDVVDLLDDEEYNGASANARVNNNRKSTRKAAATEDDSVEVIDVDDVAVAAPRAPAPTPAGPKASARSQPALSQLVPSGQRHGPNALEAASAGSSEVYTLDACGCAHPLHTLASPLSQSLTAAAAILTTASASVTAAPTTSLPPPPTAAAAAVAPPTPRRGQKRGATSTAGQPEASAAAATGSGIAPADGHVSGHTLLDVLAPLACPSPGCGCCLSSRDVRLLLGPPRAGQLMQGMCSALRREVELAGGAPVPLSGQQGTSHRAESRSEEQEEAEEEEEEDEGHAGGRRKGRKGRRGARRQAGGGSCGAAQPQQQRANRGGGDNGGGRGGNGAAGVGVGWEGLVHLSLAPLCSVCGARMEPYEALGVEGPEERQQQGATGAAGVAEAAAPRAVNGTGRDGGSGRAGAAGHNSDSDSDVIMVGGDEEEEEKEEEGTKQRQQGKRRRPARAAGPGPSSGRAQAHTVPGVGNAAAAAPAQRLMSAQQLRAALAARGQLHVATGASQRELGRLLAAALGQEGQGPEQGGHGGGCAFLCPACPHVCSLEEGPPKDRVQLLQRQAAQAARVLQLLQRARSVVTGEVADGEGGGEQQHGPGQGRSHRSRGSKGRRSHHGHGSHGSKAWAKGVGYGGSGGMGGAGPSQRDLQAARARQQQQDDQVRECLEAIRDLLSHSNSSSSGGGARGAGGAAGGGGGGSGGGGQPPLLLAALLCGGLPYVLRLLLQNDSLADMAARQGLYGAVLALVRRFLTSMDLLELLVCPATDPRDASTAPTAGPQPPPTAAADPSLADVLRVLAVQCRVFRRAAEDLAEGCEDDIAALGFSLELGAVCEEVAAGADMWRAAMAGATGVLAPLLDAQASLPGGGPATGPGASAPAPGPAAAPDGPPSAKRACRTSARLASSRGVASPGGPGALSSTGTTGSLEQQQAQQQQGGGAAAGPAAAAEADAAARRRSAYVSEMRPLQFREVALQTDHYFTRIQGGAGTSQAVLNYLAGGVAMMMPHGGAPPQPPPQQQPAQAGGDIMRRRLRRITGEVSALATGLPLDWEAAAFVAVDESRVDVLRALLLPASDTPYANGAFIFDIMLPPGYPDQPPQVKFLTTGGGRVRFNPNLYADGKVCLSLLGTWTGPSWNPQLSTLLQVLVSIQSMILVTDPYYNEPGWESQANSAAGRQACEAYSNHQRYNTVAHAILPALQMLAQEQEAERAAAGGAGTSAGQSRACPLAGGRTFSDVLRRHYRAKRPELQRQMADWRAAVAQGAAAAGGQSHGMHGMAQYLGMQGQGGGNQVEFMEKAVRQVLELLEKI